MSLPVYLPFLLLLAAVFGLWMHRAIWIGALLAAIIAGYSSGALRGAAALWIALLAALGLAYRDASGALGPNRPERPNPLPPESKRS